jgi:hypothetical protein
MYRDSIEGDEEGDEAVTEVVTGAATEAVAEDIVPTGATVAGMSPHVLIRVPAD